MTEHDVVNLRNRRASNRWERMSVGDVIERLTWSRPHQEAIVAAPGAATSVDRQRLTYLQAERLVNQVAHGLLADGLERGDRVLMGCENSVEALIVKLGIAKAGLVAVPLNPSMAADVVHHAILLARPRSCVLDAELWDRFGGTLTSEGLTPRVTLAYGSELPPGSQWFDEFVAGRPSDEPVVTTHADDIWQMLFTSGTTAMPKASMTSHMSTYMAALTYALSLSRGVAHESSFKLCTFLPVIYHIAGDAFTLPAFFSGGTLIIGRRFDPALIARTVTREGATAIWGGAPAMLRELVTAFRDAPILTSGNSVEVVAHGWGSLPPGLAADLRRTLSPTVRMFTIFGQTEAVSSSRFWAHRDREVFIRNSPAINYVGRPNPMLAERIVDEFGEPITQPNVPGEVVLRSPVVTSGYYRNTNATKEAFEGGWFHTGDICMYDEDGRLIMVDRLKDIIKSGGENVSSIRIEAVLLQHESVDQAAVVGLPHVRWGEAVTAVVVPRPGSSIDVTALVGHCKSTLAGFECPKQVVVVDELPVTVGGKVLKYRLRQQLSNLYGAEISTPIKE